jgi:hypothetical protein
VWGADYYVDCAVANGTNGEGDCCDGTPGNDPFESINDVELQSFSTGDGLYFLAGSECIEDANSTDNDTLNVDWTNATVGCYWVDGGSPNTDCTGKTKPIINHYVG